MSELDRLYAGEVQAVLVHADGTQTTDFITGDAVVLAGSFNPVHTGHRRMLEVASRMSGRRGIFEISITNVDKPELPARELHQRLAQFRGMAEVAVTRAALFSDKARALPGAWFVLGYDTATRLVDDRYYSQTGGAAGTTGEAARQLGQLQAAGVKFMIAGRVASDGKFRGLRNLDIPSDLNEMFIDIPESQFREDITSTALRQARPR